MKELRIGDFVDVSFIGEITAIEKISNNIFCTVRTDKPKGMFFGEEVYVVKIPQHLQCQDI